jgi:hypothetical protein
MVQRTKSARAEYAESVGIVDDQDSIMPSAQRCDTREIGYIAVHAEYGVGHHECPRFPPARQYRVQFVDLAVWETAKPGTT